MALLHTTYGDYQIPSNIYRTLNKEDNNGLHNLLSNYFAESHQVFITQAKITVNFIHKVNKKNISRNLHQ